MKFKSKLTCTLVVYACIILSGFFFTDCTADNYWNDDIDLPEELPYVDVENTIPSDTTQLDANSIVIDDIISP